MVRQQAFSVRKSGIWPYSLGIIIGGLVPMAAGIYWLDMIPVWLAAVLGGASGALGVFMRENIGEALIFTVLTTTVLALLLWFVAGLDVGKGLAFSFGTGLCIGKLVGGVWKEIAT